MSKSVEEQADDYAEKIWGTERLYDDARRVARTHYLAGAEAMLKEDSACRMKLDKIFKAKVRECEELKWKLRQFKSYSTDACATCESGRVSLFIANTSCISCAPESYEVPAEFARLENKNDIEELRAALACAKEDLFHCYENKCVPTLAECVAANSALMAHDARLEKSEGAE